MNWLTGITLVIAVVGLLLSVFTFFQKVKTDKRSEWWKRTEWCLNNLSTDLGKVAGKLLTYQLSVSKLITNEEKAAIDIAINESILEYELERSKDA